MDEFVGKTVASITEDYNEVKITFTDGTFINLKAEGYEGTHLELVYAGVVRRRAGD